MLRQSNKKEMLILLHSRFGSPCWHMIIPEQHFYRLPSGHDSLPVGQFLHQQRRDFVCSWLTDYRCRQWSDHIRADSHQFYRQNTQDYNRKKSSMQDRRVIFLFYNLKSKQQQQKTPTSNHNILQSGKRLSLTGRMSKATNIFCIELKKKKSRAKTELTNRKPCPEVCRNRYAYLGRSCLWKQCFHSLFSKNFESFFDEILKFTS